MALPTRLMGLALLTALLGLSSSGQAGSADAPEVTDATGDPTVNGQDACPTSCAAAPQFVDLTMGWVGEETATDIVLWMDVAGNANANAYGSADFAFNFNVGGIAYVAGFHVNQAQVGDSAVSPFGVASAAEYADAAMKVTVPKSAIGAPSAGAAMTEIHVTSELDSFDEGALLFRDRAPDGAAFGLPYTFVVGGSADQNDTDADGLNDTWETEQFGNLTAQNGTGDPDGDGLNNTAEFELGTNATLADTDGDGLSDGNETELGTNATLADTDGDGFSDGEEVANGTDPLVADPSDVVDDGNGTLEDDTDGDGADGPETAGLDKYLESIKADTGYAGASAGGLLGVVVLSLLGIAVRWGL